MYFLSIAEKGSVKVFGHDKLAFKGDTVLFECQASGWFPKPTLQWQVDNEVVNIHACRLTSSIFILNKVI